MSHTYAIMEVSRRVYDEIKAKLIDAGYTQAVHKDFEEEVLDLHGLALRAVDVHEMADYQVRDTDVESRMRGIACALQPAVPDGHAFALFLFSYGPNGHCFYISSAEREGVIETLREWLKRQVQ